MITMTGSLDDKLQLDGYQALANAIVISAANDYRVTLRNLKADRHYRPTILHRKWLETFFHPEYFRLLTTVSADFLIQKLQKEAGYETPME